MSSSSNTIGRTDLPDAIPLIPKFVKKCATHPKDENPMIDPLSENGKKMKINSDGSAQCYHCQVRDIENAMLKSLPPNHPKVIEIINRRQILLAEKLLADQRNFERSKNRMKVVIKSPKRFQKKQQQSQQPNTAQKEQPTKKKLRIVVKRKNTKSQNVKGWAKLL
jgi:hypothetical protein